MIDAFVHIFQYSQEKFCRYLLSRGQCLNWLSLVLLVNRCLSFTLSFWLPLPFPPPFSSLHYCWGHLDCLEGMDHVWLSKILMLTLLSVCPVATAHVKQFWKHRLFSALCTVDESVQCSLVYCLLTPNRTPLLDPLSSLSFSLSPF